MHDLSLGALPNDDLDLQLVWLCAAENYGRNVNSQILGEYWLNYIVADWSEYGAGKNNMRMGILPPLSGLHNNHNRNSCGCFIRSEIWACLMPGHPELAVKFAYEDAIVDHSEEGVYAEIFCTAMESAAFSESSTEKLIAIGLSYIPETCAIAKAIQTVKECYNNGLDWKMARKKILQDFPGSFGMYAGYEDRPIEEDIPVGELGYDDPSNIGLMMIGWIYGEGDFERSICIAAGCGEDADCTAATLGSLMGIIMGGNCLPEKWVLPIGEEIKTISINLTNGLSIPKTVTELTNRVVRTMPIFMGEFCNILSDEGVLLSLNNEGALFDSAVAKGIFKKQDFKEVLQFQPYGLKMENTLLMAVVRLDGGVNIIEGLPKKVTFQLENKVLQQQWIRVLWHIPFEWKVLPCRETMICLDQKHGGNAITEFEYEILPTELSQGKHNLILELRPEGRISPLFVPIVFLVGN